MQHMNGNISVSTVSGMVGTVYLESDLPCLPDQFLDFCIVFSETVALMPFAVVSSADTRQTPSHQPWAFRHTRHWQERQSWPKIQPSVSKFLSLGTFWDGKFNISEDYNAMQQDFFLVPGHFHQQQAPPILRMPTAVEMKDLLWSPSPHKQPLRPGHWESAWLCQILNHAGLLCLHELDNSVWPQHGSAEQYHRISCAFPPLLWVRCSGGCFMLWCA